MRAAHRYNRYPKSSPMTYGSSKADLNDVSPAPNPSGPQEQPVAVPLESAKENKGAIEALVQEEKKQNSKKQPDPKDDQPKLNFYSQNEDDKKQASSNREIEDANDPEEIIFTQKDTAKVIAHRQKDIQEINFKKQSEREQYSNDNTVSDQYREGQNLPSNYANAHGAHNRRNASSKPKKKSQNQPIKIIKNINNNNYIFNNPQIEIKNPQMQGGSVINAQQYYAASSGQTKSTTQQYPNPNGITVIKENNIIMSGPNMAGPQQTNMMTRRLAE